MSLINEALKRAEQEKLRLSGRRRASEAIPASGPGPLPVRGESNWRRGRRELMALVGLVAVVGGWAGWSALRADRLQDRPVVSRAASSLMRPELASHDAVKAFTAAASAAYHKSVDVAKYYRPTSEAARFRGPNPAAPAKPDRPEAAGHPAAAARAQITKQGADLTGAAAPPRPVPRGQPAKPAAAQMPTASAKAAATAGPAPPPARKPDTTRFKLTGIMEGPGGGAAIINGYPIHLGEVIDEARLIRIDRHSVMLEVSGRRVRIRM